MVKITPEIKEAILEAMPSYPKSNGEKGNDIEKGYFEATDALIETLDSMTEQAWKLK
jgi:hypothetical protein